MNHKQQIENPDFHWPGWEKWKFGWQMRPDPERDVMRLHFEDEDIEHLLPPHLPPERNPFGSDTHVPVAPCFNPNDDAQNWVIRFPLENGWEAIAFADHGVALNAASFTGINRRAVGPGLWLRTVQQWDDPGLAWQDYEMENIEGFIGCSGHIEDPDHLIACIRAVAELPSDPDVRRLSSDSEFP